MATITKRKRTRRTLTLKGTTPTKRKATRTTPTGNTLSLARSKPTPKQTKEASKPVQAEPKAKAEPIPTRNRQGNQLNKILKDKYTTWRDCTPLKIGIQETIIEAYKDQFSKGAIRLLLKRHTRRPDYLNNVLEGDTRYDLEGNKAGIIKKNDKSYAQKCLDWWDSQKKGTPE